MIGASIDPKCYKTVTVGNPFVLRVVIAIGFYSFYLHNEENFIKQCMVIVKYV